MNNIIFRHLGNSIFQGFVFKESIIIGSIVGEKKGNYCHINNFRILPKYRYRSEGTNLLNMFETKMHNIHDVNIFQTFAWDNTYCITSSYLEFYLKNNYSICKKSKTIYHDNGDKIYCVTPVYKKFPSISLDTEN